MSMISLLQCRIRVTLDDESVIVGRLLSYDGHQNLILSDAERERTSKKDSAKVLRETVGLIFLRGKCVLTISHTPGIATKAAVIDSRTDGRAAEARRLASKRTNMAAPLDIGQRH
jgi:small nuclear ribonucleoprotein (snRNP)-like protein